MLSHLGEWPFINALLRACLPNKRWRDCSRIIDRDTLCTYLHYFHDLLTTVYCIDVLESSSFNPVICGIVIKDSDNEGFEARALVVEFILKIFNLLPLKCLLSLY